MRVLALDTASRTTSLAVLEGTRVLAARVTDAAEPPSVVLPRELSALLADVGLHVRDVDVFGIAIGPGSFTGVRVGIATIQGLALVFGRPVVPVSTLEAWAWLVHAPASAETAVWIDAQRGEVYAARYAPRQPREDEAGHLPAIEPPRVGPPRAILDAWRPSWDTRHGEIVFVGDGAVRYRDDIEAVVGGRARLVVPEALLAVAVGDIAARRAARGETVRPHAIVPLYVRRPDAELARERRDEQPVDRRAGGL